jgi:hypothetical protein
MITETSGMLQFPFTILPSQRSSRRKESVNLSEAFGLDKNSATNNFETTKEWGLWFAKALLALYFAACLWNIVAAVKDAVIKGLEPVISVWNFVCWAFGH